MHRLRNTLLIFVCAGSLLPGWADMTIKLGESPTVIDGSWNESGTIHFNGNKSHTKHNPDTLPYYQEQYFNQGLHFKGGKSYTMTNKTTGSGGCVFGVFGEGTEVVFNGTMIHDGDSFNNIWLKNGGKFVIHEKANIDLVNDALYTRQFWVLGDGTGVFEVQEGFVADKTKDGTTAFGAGSFRFANAIFISHHTQSLPTNGMAGCDNCGDFNGVNGHLVFERHPGGKWIAKTNPQVYPAAIWIDVDMTIEAHQDITHTGRYVELHTNGYGTYKLGGAFQMKLDNVTVTKTGPANLILAGEQAYKPGSVLKITQGGVVHRCDATGGAFRGDGTERGGQELAIQVADNAVVSFQHSPVRIRSLSLSNNSIVEVALGAEADVASGFTAKGTLRISNALGKTPKVGDSYQLFARGPSGNFSSVEPLSGGNWDLSKLYSEGKVILQGGSVSIAPQCCLEPVQDAGLGFDLLGRWSPMRAVDVPAVRVLPGQFH